MEAPRHWRMRFNRLRLQGWQRIRDGEIEVSLTGSSWSKLPQKFEKKEDRPEEIIVFQAADSELVSAR